LNEIADLPDEPAFTPVDVVVALGGELRAHGHAAAAEAAFARALRWYAERPAAERATPTMRAATRRRSTSPAASRRRGPSSSSSSGCRPAPCGR
jgi:hypothetical protein